jgi:hypothetical protein
MVSLNQTLETLLLFVPHLYKIYVIFQALEEYLIKGNVSPGSTVLLLTDDQMAIEEAQLLHPAYDWKFWNRTRRRGQTNNRHSHILNDHAREFLILLIELELAGQCVKGVHGISNMKDLIQYSMIRKQNGLTNTQLIDVDNNSSPGGKSQDEGTLFLQDIEAKLEAERRFRQSNPGSTS